MTLLLGVVGCLSVSPESTPPSCQSAVTIAVGSGTQPTVDWQPACAASRVFVRAAGSGQLPLWDVTTYFDGVMPPLRVGAPVRGADVWGPGASLTLGSPYVAYVVRGWRGDVLIGVDSLVFTARP
jgi:hypothetical protein